MEHFLHRSPFCICDTYSSMNGEEKSLGRLGKMLFGIHGSICVACRHRPVTEWRTFVHIQNNSCASCESQHHKAQGGFCNTVPALQGHWGQGTRLSSNLSVLSQCVHTETSAGFPTPAFPGETHLEAAVRIPCSCSLSRAAGTGKDWPGTAARSPSEQDVGQSWRANNSAKPQDLYLLYDLQKV